MMKMLSDTELVIAEWYCHGLTDKEIAEVLDKPVWTVRTHKKHIYSKLGISTTHELVLYMVSRHFGKVWNLREVRRSGLAAVLCSLMLFHIIFTERQIFCRVPRRIRVECVSRRTEK